MNIAFFCDAYYPTRNGVAVSSATTAEELRARGHRVVIFAPRYKGYQDSDKDVVRFPARHFAKVKDFPVVWPFLPHLSFYTRMRFLRERFDIVHTHSPFTLGTLGARWARRSKIPVVFTFHTLYHRYVHYAPVSRQLARSYILWRVRKYCAWCDYIIAPSQPIARLVQRLCPGVPSIVLPTGVDVERFTAGNRSAVRARYGISDDTVLLYVGRLVPEKNLDFLLRSIAPILQETAISQQSTAIAGEPSTSAIKSPQSPRVRLMLVGGGPAKTSLQALAAQLQISQRVIFTDFVEPPALPDYYAAGDIFVFASRTETQGVSIAEALAAGLPCVVVGAMGAAEAITNQEDGLIVPPREERFQEAVTRLIEDASLRARLSANARCKALTLSRSRCVDSLLDLYRSLLDRHASI